MAVLSLDASKAFPDDQPKTHVAYLEVPLFPRGYQEHG